ncbi:transposase [Fictibacillus macauensis ZFHKF-1]|uniref:Transposase n=1 Tax=Fictibacillus macauensis ZFHKF-1 TaxID=1196324 RepID=I8AFT2_9BACL|nr:transposase [Fictibacillus macauensis ZFHKF-1]
MEKQKHIYEAAQVNHPERWAQETRNWEPNQCVALNPMREERRIYIRKARFLLKHESNKMRQLY